MTIDSRVLQVLLLYEELLEQGEAVSLQQLCQTQPHLLPELQQRLNGLRALQTYLNTGPVASGSSSHAALCLAGPSLAQLRYRPLRLHRQGGVGEVLIAEDEVLHRQVALKRIKPPHDRHPDRLRRFLLEAEITGKLEHPGVVPVYAVGQDDEGRPCYAMRLIQGETLDEAIRRSHHPDRPAGSAGERRLEFHQLLGRFVAVCNTVAYAHSRGVLHRDLKPGNIMLGKYGETLVVDWGLAKSVERSAADRAGEEKTLVPSPNHTGRPTRLGEIMGTAPYMSPEQAAGRWDVVGIPSDIYALGAILYKLLTGTAPCQDAPAGQVLDRVRKGVFLLPRQHRRDVSRPLEAVCLKAMALKPEQRYRKALDLAADVEHWLADEPVSAYRETRLARLRRGARRHGVLVKGLAAAVLAVVLLGGGWLWLTSDQEHPRRGTKQTPGAQQPERIPLPREAGKRPNQEVRKAAAERPNKKVRRAL